MLFSSFLMFHAYKDFIYVFLAPFDPKKKTICKNPRHINNGILSVCTERTAQHMHFMSFHTIFRCVLKLKFISSFRAFESFWTMACGNASYKQRSKAGELEAGMMDFLWNIFNQRQTHKSKLCFNSLHSLSAVRISKRIAFYATWKLSRNCLTVFKKGISKLNCIRNWVHRELKKIQTYFTSK